MNHANAFILLKQTKFQCEKSNKKIRTRTGESYKIDEVLKNSHIQRKNRAEKL